MATRKPNPNPPISKIESGLFLGDLGSSYNLEILKENDITAMISLSDGTSAVWSSPRNRERIPAGRHLFIPALDSSTQDLISRFAEMCDFIEDKRGGAVDKNVLVHCTVGVSRSATIVIAYLMRKHHMSLDEALAYVSNNRKIKPSSNFKDQLTVWGEVDYEIWEDEMKQIPKPAYKAFLARRAAKLKEKGLTGNEPIWPTM